VVDGQAAVAHVEYGADGRRVAVNDAPPAADARIVVSDHDVLVLLGGRQTAVRLKDHEAIDIEHLDGGGAVTAPMHGKVLAVLVDAGAEIRKGDRVAVIEAMKMEHTLLAPIDGRVDEVAVAAGAQVAQGALILRIAE
jgi:3-methylcrotonyl-CoA carboxylase alpha subunit